MIYKGRIDVDKLPAVDLHKKNSLHVPPQLQRSNLDSHLFPMQHQNQSGNDHEQQNGLSSFIPNLEPALPREESFT